MSTITHTLLLLLCIHLVFSSKLRKNSNKIKKSESEIIVIGSDIPKDVQNTFLSDPVLKALEDKLKETTQINQDVTKSSKEADSFFRNAVTAESKKYAEIFKKYYNDNFAAAAEALVRKKNEEYSIGVYKIDAALDAQETILKEAIALMRTQAKPEYKIFEDARAEEEKKAKDVLSSDNTKSSTYAKASNVKLVEQIKEAEIEKKIQIVISYLYSDIPYLIQTMEDIYVSKKEYEYKSANAKTPALAQSNKKMADAKASTYAKYEAELKSKIEAITPFIAAAKASAVKFAATVNSATYVK